MDADAKRPGGGTVGSMRTPVDNGNRIEARNLRNLAVVFYGWLMTPNVNNMYVILLFNIYKVT